MNLSTATTANSIPQETPAVQTVKKPSRNHLASLDGLRALSIFFVLLTHIGGHDDNLLAYYGHLGVSIFFVISGTLISWLMIREREETGSLSLKDFYVRRALRILPAYVLLVLVVVGMKFAQIAQISWVDILRALTFTHDYPLNFHGAEYAWWLEHTWSLSVEEQFYLIWPGLFALLPRKGSVYLAAVLAFAGPILRGANYYFFPVLRGHEGRMFHTRVDILMMGCLAAFLLNSPEWVARIKRIPRGPALMAAFVFLLAIEPYSSHFRPHTAIHSILLVILPTMEAVAIALGILVLVVNKGGVGFALFNQPAFMHFGKMSYSLYLWQQLFLGNSLTGNMASLAWRLPCIYVLSFCSFNYLEKPFLRLRKKFRRVSED